MSNDRTRRVIPVICAVALLGGLALPARARDAQADPPAQGQAVAARTGSTIARKADELAMELNNPLASLISLPFQANWDLNVGPEDGTRFVMNFQPVLPFSLNEDWNLITRIVMPVIGQPVLMQGGESSFGIGDTSVSMFFSPKQGRLIWGLGPVVVLPITSDPALGTGKFSCGPTGVVLRQSGKWTYGALANHVWSVAGAENRADVSQTYVQPFLSYTTRSAATFALNAESTYDWKADDDEWTVPFNVLVSKLLRLGNSPISVGIGVRYYAETPQGGPDWGFRIPLTILLPLK